MSQVDDLRDALNNLAGEAEKEVGLLLAARERLSARHIEAAELMRGSGHENMAKAMNGISDVYTDLEDQVGKLNWCIQTVRTYAAGL